MLRDSDSFNNSLFRHLSDSVSSSLTASAISSPLEYWSQNNGFERRNNLSLIHWHEDTLLGFLNYILSKIYHKLRRFLAIKFSSFISAKYHNKKILRSISHIPHTSNLFTRHLGLPYHVDSYFTQLNLPDNASTFPNIQFRSFLKDQFLNTLKAEEFTGILARIVPLLKSICNTSIDLLPLNLLENNLHYYKLLLSDKYISYYCDSPKPILSYYIRF